MTIILSQLKNRYPYKIYTTNVHNTNMYHSMISNQNHPAESTVICRPPAAGRRPPWFTHLNKQFVSEQRTSNLKCPNLKILCTKSDTYRSYFRQKYDTPPTNTMNGCLLDSLLPTILLTEREGQELANDRNQEINQFQLSQ